MLVSYPEAARSKLCSISNVAEAVRAGRIEGDDVFVVWNEGYERWDPPVRINRIVSALNARVLDAKIILKAVSSKPIPEVHEMTSRTAREMNAHDWFVIPVFKENLELLLRMQDGYYDGQPYSDAAHEELLQDLDDGHRLYQRRLGLTGGQYKGRDMFPSQCATLKSAASLAGRSTVDVVGAYESGLVDMSPYRGNMIVHLNRRFSEWGLGRGQEVGSMSFMEQEKEDPLGCEFDMAFWDIS